MESPKIKFLIENTSGEWSKIIIDSDEYIIKFEVNEGVNRKHSITCCLSDFKSMWLETIKADDVTERLKRCNPLLACSEMMAIIISTITTIPRNENHMQLTELNDNDYLHLNTKYHLSDGSDSIPLKFYWQLEKGVPQSFYQLLTEMLVKIGDLEKTNNVLNETVRDKDEKLETIASNNRKDVVLLDSTAESDSDGDLNVIGISHDGVKCDFCQRIIIGHRYTCIECEDFDLCMGCEYKELQHTQHIMVRYAQPEDIHRSHQVFQAFSKNIVRPTPSRKRRSSRL